MPRTLVLLLFLGLMAGLACAQTDPCRREQARAGQSTLGITLDSLRLTALRPAGACRVVAEGRYRGRTLAAFGWKDGALTDTLALPADSARTQLVGWSSGALRVRLGGLASDLGLTYSAPGQRPEDWSVSLLALPTLGVLPPLPLDAGPEEAARFAQTRIQVLAAGADDGTLALLVRRIDKACTGTPGCCLPDRYSYYLILLQADGLGKPTTTGAQIWPLPGMDCPSPPAPPCLGMPPAAEAEEASVPLAAAQPVVRLRDAWLLHTGKAQLAVRKDKIVSLSLPPGVRAAHVWAEGGAQEGRLYYRRGGKLRQAAEQEAFRLRERYVVSGLAEATLTLKGGTLEMGKPQPLDVPDGAALRGIPLAWLGNHWWLAGYGRVKPVLPNAR